MKRNILLITAAALIALMGNINAEDVSFSSLSSGMAAIRAGAQTVPDPTPAPASSVSNPVPSPTAPPAAQREWLVLVFMNGRNNLWSSAVADVNEMETAGSTDKVAVTVELGLLQDRGTSMRFLVQKDTAFPVDDLVSGDRNISHIISPAVKVPNADMGSWEHFADFAKWSMRRYPSKKVLAIIWNHGSGRIDIGGADNSGAELGVAYDDLTRNFIRNKQIAMALNQIRAATGKKVDILDTDACLMQMASVAYELKDVTDFVVGAEEIVPGPGLPYDTVLAALTANPGMSPEQLSRTLVEKFHAFYDSNNAALVAMGALELNAGTTLSAIRTSASADFVAALNAWALKARDTANYPVLKAAMSKTLAFEYDTTGDDTSSSAHSRDLYDFVLNVNSEPGVSPEFKALGEDLMRFITNGKYIIANDTTGPNNAYVRAKGIAVYVPKLLYDPSYDETMFARDSLWDDLIKFMLDQGLKGL